MACGRGVFIALVTTTMLTPFIRLKAALGQAHAQRAQDFLDARDGQRSDAVGFDDFVDAHQLDEVMSFRLTAGRRGLGLLAVVGYRARRAGWQLGLDGCRHLGDRLLLLAKEGQQLVVAEIEIDPGTRFGHQHLIATQAITHLQLTALAIGGHSPGAASQGYYGCQSIHNDLDHDIKAASAAISNRFSVRSRRWPWHAAKV